ncbi:MAG: 2-(1,2-epoxy-1,2-dihydrophenyl)acetyl-CoA isomerase, partial [Ilumatobacter sp.]
VVPLNELRAQARSFAGEIAKSAPLAVRSIRATLRGDLADQFRAATAHEATEQEWLRKTADFAEGTRAMAERHEPTFRGA